MRVLAFGEILWDFIEGVEHLGGAPFNFAAHTARCGNEVFIVSRLGTDVLGSRALAECKRLGVGASLIEWDQEHATGVVNVTLSKGQPDYTILTDVAYDFIQADAAVKIVATDPFDVFYFGSLAQRNEVSADALKRILQNGKFKHIFYDVNLRKDGYTPLIIKRSLSACTVFKLNADEVPVIGDLMFGEALSAEALSRQLVSVYPSITTIIVTAAERGCYVFSQGEFTHIPGTPVKVVDAVGAGDSFSASFMHVLGTHGDPLRAARVANQIGAFVATQSGAIPEYSSEIRMLLSGNHARA